MDKTPPASLQQYINSASCGTLYSVTQATAAEEEQMKGINLSLSGPGAAGLRRQSAIERVELKRIRLADTKRAGLA